MQFVTIEEVRASENCGCVNSDEPSDELLEEMIDAASDVLALISGGVVMGRREVTVRPCGEGACGACLCCGLDGIPLWGPNPVVSEVRIDGDILAVEDYGMHYTRGGDFLVRLGTGARPPSWPRTQDLWKPNTEDHTFSITFEYGLYLDWLATQAALELVCDFATLSSKKKNALPKGTTNATMGNVTVMIDDRVARLRAGEAGPITAEFLSVYAPYGRAPSAVWAPELDYGWSMSVVTQ